MDTLPPRPGESGLNTGRWAGSTTNMYIFGTQQERSNMLVHRDATNSATKHMTQDAHLKIVCRAGSRKSRRPHAMGCEHIHIEARGNHLAV